MPFQEPDANRVQPELEAMDFARLEEVRHLDPLAETRAQHPMREKTGRSIRMHIAEANVPIGVGLGEPEREIPSTELLAMTIVFARCPKTG
jgi:hypothetical protein